jgi:hypothetical protein
MNHVATNYLLADLIGLQAMWGPGKGFKPGAYWDRDGKRTRMVRDSEMHEVRRKMSIQETEASGFIFDVFTNPEDLERVEKFLGIPRHDAETRVKVILERVRK